MSAGVVAALALAVLIGLALGALGGGGSILTLPIFVFIAGVPTARAVPMSMVVVGGVSLIAAVIYVRRGHFHPQAALYFSITGVVGAYFGSFLTPLVSDRLLLLIFAALMLAAGAALLGDRADAGRTARCNVVRCLLIGAVVGGLTGFLGVGGGFLIVPALVLFAGVETKPAVGTSLAVITVNAAGGLVGQMQQTTIDWPLTLGFLGLALLGMFGGLAVARRVASQRLQRIFGWFIILLALLIASLTLAGFSLPSGSG